MYLNDRTAFNRCVPARSVPRCCTHAQLHLAGVCGAARRSPWSTRKLLLPAQMCMNDAERLFCTTVLLATPRRLPARSCTSVPRKVLRAALASGRARAANTCAQVAPRHLAPRVWPHASRARPVPSAACTRVHRGVTPRGTAPQKEPPLGDSVARCVRSAPMRGLAPHRACAPASAAGSSHRRRRFHAGACRVHVRGLACWLWPHIAPERVPLPLASAPSRLTCMRSASSRRRKRTLAPCRCL